MSAHSDPPFRDPGSTPSRSGEDPSAAEPLPLPEPGAPAPPPSSEPSLRDAGRALSSALRREGSTRWQAVRSGIARRTASVRTGAADAPGVAPDGGMPATESRPRRRKAPGSRAIRRGWRLFIGALLCLGIGVTGTLVGLWLTMRDLPLSNVLPPTAEPTLLIRTVDGQVLTTRGAYRAPYAALDEMPPHLIEAVIAIEDQRFREHDGVDWRGIARALFRNVSAGGVVEGGSTITQQLVKILYLGPERTLSRKLQEAVLATTLERQLAKERILELYLNSVYLGSGAYGAPAAAETYYGKELGELSLPESALLAASIQSPSRVNPISDLGAAQNRAALVLTLMADQGRIDEATRDQALAQLAVLAPEPQPSRAGSYFGDWVLKEAVSLEGAGSQGLTATATLDLELQADAERILREVMADQGAAVGASQAALVAMTPNGRVRAMVGGLDYKESQFNRATDALRQPGSTFKLFVYMAALILGASPDSTISDDAIEIDGWEPRNFGGQSHGTVTLRDAFTHSYNQATVRLAQEVGVDNIVSVARRFGIKAELKPTPSLALGTSEVTLLDMTEAYAAMALGRTPVNATGIEALRFGKNNALGVTGTNDREQTRLTRTRDPMLGMLRAVVSEGTGREAAVRGLRVAGKTGTSQDSRDAWFIGFGGGLVIGVWVGNDDNSPMDEVTGGGLPAEIFRRVMQAAQNDGPARVAPAPAQAEGPQCDIRACSAAYQSFRAEDCTYQPYQGPRRICTR